MSRSYRDYMESRVALLEVCEDGKSVLGIRRSHFRTSTVPDDLFPLTPEEWRRAVVTLRLTRQQAKIVEQILRGLKDKEVAKALGLSEPTVRTHLTRLFARLEVDDRVQLVLRVLACRQHPRGDHDSSKSITL